MASNTRNRLATLRREMLKNWRLYVFLLLPLIYLIVFKYVPMTGIQIAFRDYNGRMGIWGSRWVGLKHFDKFFNSFYFERVIWNNIAISLYGLVAGFPVAIVFALCLNSIRSKRYQSIIQNITYMPHFISSVVMVGILLQVFDTHRGIFAQIWTNVMSTDVPNLMQSTTAFPHMYVWSGVWQHLGWDSIIYMAALSSVNPELHEAAELDGASRFQRVLHIDFPAIVPTITITLILACGKIMDIGFDKIYLMQNNLNLSASEVLSTYVYKVGLASGGNFSYGAAIGLFNSVINLLLIVLVNKISDKVSGSSLW